MKKQIDFLPEGYGVCPNPTDPRLDQVGPRGEVLSEVERRARRVAERRQRDDDALRAGVSPWEDTVSIGGAGGPLPKR